MSGGFYFDVVVRHSHSYIMKTLGWLLVNLSCIHQVNENNEGNLGQHSCQPLSGQWVRLCADSTINTLCFFLKKFILGVVEAMECVVDPPLISHPLSVSNVTRFKEQAVYKHLLTHLVQTFICWACGKHLHGAHRWRAQ